MRKVFLLSCLFGFIGFAQKTAADYANTITEQELQELLYF